MIIGADWVILRNGLHLSVVCCDSCSFTQVVIHWFSVSCVHSPVLCRLVCTFCLLTPSSDQWDCCGQPLGASVNKTVLRSKTARLSITGGGSLWSQILYLDDHHKLVSEPAKALKVQEFEIA